MPLPPLHCDRARATARPWIAPALLLLVTTLAACQRSAPVPGPSAAAPGAALPSPQRADMDRSGGDPSLPDAGRALAGTSGPAPATAAGGEPATNQRNGITAEQESKAMPLPGQANDHSNMAGEKSGPASAPVPGTAASAPR